MRVGGGEVVAVEADIPNLHQKVMGGEGGGGKMIMA